MEGNREVILRDSWQFVVSIGKRRRQPGYVKALEHQEYVKQRYDLFTFIMEHSLSGNSADISKITGFRHYLQLRHLHQEEGVWYACSEPAYLPEEISAAPS